MDVNFLFVGEGPSDAGMVPHLTALCIAAGAEAVTGVQVDFSRLAGAVGHTVQSKLKAALALEPEANLIFVHRDQDKRPPDERRAEIAMAVSQIACDRLVVPVVPIRETEAWLLLDEAEIRAVVGRPKGAVPLQLPRLKHVEAVADPKQLLQDALIIASGASGRRLAKIRGEFGKHRRQLLERLLPSEALGSLTAWRQLRIETEEAIATLAE